MSPLEQAANLARKALRDLQDCINTPEDAALAASLLDLPSYPRYRVVASISCREDPLTVGCWIETRWGQAVVTQVMDGYVQYVYEATRCVDGERMWVTNSDAPQWVSYLAPPNTVSREALAWNG